MPRLIVRYALLAVAVVVLNFLLPRLLPGDPLDGDPSGGMERATPALTADARARLRATYRLDQPLSSQFAAYLADLSHGDLGWSMSKAAPVGELIAERLPWTLGLVLTSTAIAAVSGSLLGLLAAWRGGRIDRLLLSASTGLSAIPEFLVALGLLLALSLGLGWFPLQGGRTSFGPPSTDFTGGVAAALDVAWHLSLPALTLVLASLAGFILVTRGAARTVLAEPFLVTARAKGISEQSVALRHAAPNALLPVLTFLGVRVGQVLGGAIVVERVFAVPGLGLLAFEAVRARDYSVLQAVFLLGSLGTLLVSFLLEVLYRRLQPRQVGGQRAAA